MYETLKFLILRIKFSYAVLFLKLIQPYLNVFSAIFYEMFCHAFSMNRINAARLVNDKLHISKF
ncbi:hypothetical protein SAMN04488552_2580 [Christiangramia echinicola]|uniref:Uncharacterized protein n=1 Tax=Christiangramia echinicola TaxID=279359 RepID=A0A1H1QNR7_9FLAO|nr:hypothetical protein SAMN04488552_2580 [Christiangramia echinicola]